MNSPRVPNELLLGSGVAQMNLGIILGIAGVLALLPFAVLFVAFAFSDQSVWESCATVPSVARYSRKPADIVDHVSRGRILLDMTGPGPCRA
jgi:hypothetical protein